jgi:hypothetical protein
MLSCHLCLHRSINALLSAHSLRFSRNYAYASAALVAERRANHRLKGILKDPHKLSDAVKVELLKGQNNKALQLTREGSRNVNSVVSWNHIISHSLERGDIRSAFRAYNEVCSSYSFARM